MTEQLNLRRASCCKHSTYIRENNLKVGDKLPSQMN